MSLKDTFALGQSLEEIDNLRIELDRYKKALRRIVEIDPEVDSEHGCNEWGESQCWHRAREIAEQALKG